MFDKLEPEFRVGPSQSASASSGPLGAQVPLESNREVQGVVRSAIEDEALSPETRDLIERCMLGTEPPGRELKSHEVAKFSAIHVQICLMRSAGFRLNDIATILGVGSQMVYNVSSHPYARKIIFAMMHRQGARVLDIRTKLTEFADILLDETFKLAIEETDLEKQSKVTFALLDRAGFGPRQTVDINKKSSTGSASEHTLSRLADALNESTQADRIAATFTSKPAPDESRVLGEDSADPGGDLRGGSLLPSAASGSTDQDAEDRDPSIVANIRGHVIRRASNG